MFWARRLRKNGGRVKTRNYDNRSFEKIGEVPQWGAFTSIREVAVERWPSLVYLRHATKTRVATVIMGFVEINLSENMKKSHLHNEMSTPMCTSQLF